MKKRGFFTICENNDTHDYVRMAYALALSLRNTQKKYSNLSIGITPGQKISKKYSWIFDEIIELPWLDNAENESWKLENEWKVYHITPYEETIKLDADMLFVNDISHWWDLLETRDFWITSKVKTFRNNDVVSNYYRKTFTENKLPNVYTAFMYFKKCELSQNIFKMAENIFQSPGDYFSLLNEKNRPVKPTTDVVFSLAIKFLDVQDQCLLDLNIDCPTFVHMKPKIQNLKSFVPENNWTEVISCFVNENKEIKINGFKQQYPFHYHDKNFLTKEIIQILENNNEKLESTI